MSVDVKQLVDGEEQQLAQIPFGRNRFLRMMGAALFGLATTMVMPRNALAHGTSVPYPCYGFNRCSCCSNGNCCGGCTDLTDTCTEGDGHCWLVVIDSPCAIYQCCDFEDVDGHNCICSVKTCNCCR